MISVKRALISVSDKEGIVDFAKGLKDLDVEILSTGGTARLLKENGVPVTLVSEYTKFPEMLNGRVKTLHPKIHGGILAARNNDKHMSQLVEHGITPIDMVVVNLYPFEQTIKKKDVSVEEAVENTITKPLLDVNYEGATGALIHIIGGPNMKLADTTEIGKQLTTGLKLDPEANVIWGIRVKEDMGDKIEVITIFNGIESPQILGDHGRHVLCIGQNLLFILPLDHDPGKGFGA